MKTRFLIPTAMVVAILCPGCTQQKSSDDTPALRTVEVEGVYHPGFEHAAFSPSTAEFKGQEWWLNSNKDFEDRYAEFYDGAVEDGPLMMGPAVFVRMRGRLKGPGQYGHLSRWKYEFVVEEVLEMRRAGPAR